MGSCCNRPLLTCGINTDDTAAASRVYLLCRPEVYMDQKLLLLLMNAMMFVAELQAKAKVGAKSMLLLWSTTDTAVLPLLNLGNERCPYIAVSPMFAPGLCVPVPTGV